MRTIASVVGLVLLMGGASLGFTSANHYYEWVDSPLKPHEGWGDMLVEPAPTAVVEFDDSIYWPDDDATAGEEVAAPPPAVATAAAKPEAELAMEAPAEAAKAAEAVADEGLDALGEVAAEPAATRALPPATPRAAKRRAKRAVRSMASDVVVELPPTEPVEEAPAVPVDKLPWGVKHPKAMQLDSSEEVRFVIDARPDGDPKKALANQTGALTTGDTPKADVYAAQAIGGRCFTVDPADRSSVAYSTAVPMVWTWTVTAKETGDDCLLEVYLGTVESDTFSPLRLEQIALPVVVADSSVLRDVLGLAGPVDDVMSLFAVISTIIGGIMTWFGMRRPG
ncbi:MAG: hypothetical protein KTR31_34315 [Myxococcales bacterium]|nr:hypothetical protein [Myxococcales bacterium]